MLALRAVFFSWMILIVAVVVGWVMNLIQILKIGELTMSIEVIIKCVGVIIPPLGAIMGWVGLF